MKKAIVFSLVLLAILTKTAVAQEENMGRKSAEQRTEIITKNLTEKLTLTPDQTEEARDIVLKREKLRDAGKLSKEKEKEIHNDLNKIFTKDQQKQWEQARKAEKNNKTD